jgi:hypothetical protein
VCSSWDAYDAQQDNHLSFGDEVKPGTAWRQAQLDFLERFYAQ